MRFGATRPILRMFDETKAKEFYIDFLGFAVDWEHRFAADAPLYMQVSRNGCVLHLSEHHGDATPGSAVRIPTSDLDAFHAELVSKNYKYFHPGIAEQPWGRDMSLTDPFHNRLVFTSVMTDRDDDMLEGPPAELTAQGVVEVVVPQLDPVLTFYQSLGFTIERRAQTFVVLRWESTLLFIAEDVKATAAPRWTNIRLVVADVDSMWERANSLRLPVVSAIGDREYGLRDFTVRDPAGFEVRFARILSLQSRP